MAVIGDDHSITSSASVSSIMAVFSTAIFCLRAREVLRKIERYHRRRELRITAVNRSVLDRKRLRQRSLRSISVLRNLIMEDAEPIKSVSERKIITLQNRACLHEQLIRLWSIVLDGIIIKTQVLQRDRVSRMSDT